MLLYCLTPSCKLPNCMNSTNHRADQSAGTHNTSPRIGLISNPNSGRNKKQLGQVQHLLSGHAQISHRLTESADAIAGVLADFAEQGIDVLAINGGDGTVAQVFTHLLEKPYFKLLPSIVLLPGGTTNMNVGDVGVSGNLLQAVKKLCRWSVQHQPAQALQRAILKVQPGRDQTAIYGMFFGTGAIIEGIQYCHDRLHSRGVGSEIGPGLAMARTVWGIARNDPRFTRPVSAAIAINDEPVSAAEPALILLVSSLERLFLGMTPYWGTEAGALHLSVIRHGAERFLRTLPSLLRGRPGQHATPAAGYRSHKIEKLSLHMTGTFTLDGEMYQASEITGPVIISNAGTLNFLRL